MFSKSSLILTLLIMILIGSFGSPASAQTERNVTKLAEGVYEIEHKDEGGGNTTVIIGERQVFVVDACYLPSAAQEDIAQIRTWTDKPVSFLLNTHFHNDHNFGNRVYMDAFPAMTIIAHAETKKDMDLFGPGSAMRQERGVTYYKSMLDSGKTPDGMLLTADDKKQVQDALVQQTAMLNELKRVQFQSATMTFDHDFTIDLGNREVQVMFLGRGNTSGDAVVYLPKEKIVAAGDLVVYPIPYMYDGYPTEWIKTLENLSRLDAVSIIPGHGPVLRDMTHVLLIRDVMKSAVDQMNKKLSQTSPAMFQSLEAVKGAIDLEPFRKRFIGSDHDLGPAFDEMVSHLIKIVFEEASLR